MTIIFKAKSKEAYAIKITIEILANNIKTGCFVINEKGIFLCMTDPNMKKLFDLSLPSESFSPYKFTGSKGIYLGINLSHFFRLVSSVKKKDSIELFIDDESPHDLGIKVIPKENNRVSTSFVKIQPIQNLECAIPDITCKPIIVPSAEFQKMLKDFNKLGNTLSVNAHEFKIKFECNTGEVYKKIVEFGEDEEDTKKDETEVFCQEYSTPELCRISKIAGLNSNLRIYPGKPLKITSNIGDCGRIGIYIKSKEQLEKEQLENEQRNMESDDESDEDDE